MSETGSTPQASPEAGQVPSSGTNSSPPVQAEEYFEIPVDGKVQKVKREELFAGYSKSKAADERFQQAAQTRKQVDKILATAKSNPVEALMDPALGLSKEQIKDAFEKWYSREYIEPETLTEEQLKLRDYELRVKQYEQQEQQRAEQEKQRQEDLETQHEMDSLQKEIISAMEASGLPKTKHFVSRIAFFKRQNLLNGWDAPMSVIIEQVRDERKQNVSDIIQNSSVEQLIDMFGQELIMKIRRHDLAQLRKKSNMPNAEPTKSYTSSNKERKPVYMDEVQRRLKSIS